MDVAIVAVALDALMFAIIAVAVAVDAAAMVANR